MTASVRDELDFPRAARTFAEIAHLLESEERSDARVHRVLELLDRLVPNECCALLVRPSKDPYFVIIPDAAAARRAALQSSLLDMLHVMEGNRDIEPSGTGSGHLVLPVIGADRIIGVLQLERHDVYELHHVQLLSAVASLLGVYLVMVTLKDRERRAQQALRKNESRLRVMSERDVLTDLPNRLLLNDRLAQAISLARRNHKQLAVLFVDLDGFKHINDSLGHAIGDKLLQSVATCLSACVRKSDTVSRQGGDEFVILLSEVTQAADAATSAAKMISELKKEHSIGEHRLRVTASIGLSTYPGDGEDAETLLKNADTAMYHAKEYGRDNYQFFRPDMGLQAVERQSLEGRLRYALERQELLLNYQPKVNLKTGAITSVEALLRWQHPERGVLLPEHFLTIAEDTGMIVAIGQWVLREACRQTREWLDAGLPAVPVAVNISSPELRSKQFLDGVQLALKSARLDPRYLELELTESVLMRHAESTAYALEELKAIGVQLAVDDFGTGYSSLSYLTRLPMDALKVDQSFVRHIIASTNDAVVVGAVISMGKSLKYRVIAEGVETPEQLAFLQAHGCDEGQGYYFSRPLVAQQFAKLLETGLSASFYRSLNP
jgi:diguanylate cyclase (GGDEF)-like protein